MKPAHRQTEQNECKGIPEAHAASGFGGGLFVHPCTIAISEEEMKMDGLLMPGPLEKDLAMLHKAIAEQKAMAEAANAWTPTVDLRPVPCERRVVFFRHVKQSRRTTMLEIARLLPSDTENPGHSTDHDDELTLAELRMLAVAIPVLLLVAIMRRLAVRLGVPSRQTA